MATDYMALDERIGRLEETVAKGFFDLNGRMDNLERRMDGFDGRMDGLDGRVGDLDARIGGLDARIGGLDARIGGLDARIGGLDGRVAGLDGRMARVEDRLDLLNRKMDVGFENVEGKVQTVLEHLDAFQGEMRRTTDAIVKEHRADRALIFEILKDHGLRIRAIE